MVRIHRGKARRPAPAPRHVALGAVSAAVIALLVAPAVEAVPPGSPACNATGGNTIGATGSTFVHTFTASGTFTPKQAMTITYLVVGGGGGGGGGAQNTAGGGGGAGEMISTTAAVTAGTAYTITVGGGGAGATSGTTRGTVGTPSSIGAPLSITAAGGGGGAAGATAITGLNLTNGASAGGGGGAASGTVTGGTASAPGGAGGAGRTSSTGANRAGGGGGGDGANGVASPANGSGGNGGAGTSNSITGTSVTYAAGGGGGARTTAGLGVTGVSGNGGLSAANGVAAPANRGGGGGGAGNGSTAATRTGGAGGSGVVIIAYPKNAGCFSAPQTPAFSNPTFSWTAPQTTPTGQTVSSYTVVYKRASDTTYGNIYARRVAGQTALSLDITGVDAAACAANNSPTVWTCVDPDLVSGETYQFKVFARGSAANSFGAMSAAVTYTVP